MSSLRKSLLLVLCGLSLGAAHAGEPLSDFDKLKQKAKSGNTAAEATLGNKYADGDGVDYNDLKALKWCKKSAQHGDAQGQLCLGSLYANSIGVKQDYTQAVHWWELSAKQGVAKAQFNLGLLYASGQGVEKSDEKAAKWWQLAAEQGEPDAQNDLGWLYEKGNGVKKDKAIALQWYRKAAAQGFEAAKENVERISPEGIAARCNKAVAEFQSTDKDTAAVLVDAETDINVTQIIPKSSIATYKAYYQKELKLAEEQAKYACPQQPTHQIAVRRFLPQSTKIYNRVLSGR